MRHLILDIETITPGWHEEKFAPLPWHEPVVVSLLTVETGTEQLKMSSWRMDQDGEADCIRAVAKEIVRSDRLVTFNGKGFDLPLLGMRAAALGCEWRHWIDRRHRFPNFRTPLYHYDLLEQYGDYGSARFKFDALCRMMGLPGKSAEVNGSNVGEIWTEDAEGWRQKIVDYCEQDVFDAWVCYLKFVQAYERDVGAAFVRTRDWAADIPHLAGRLK
jgi:predicted PolB exonuclease-like 3'-5' exonuclease